MLSNEFEVASTLVIRTNVATFHRILLYHTQTFKRANTSLNARKTKLYYFMFGLPFSYFNS